LLKFLSALRTCALDLQLRIACARSHGKKKYITLRSLRLCEDIFGVSGTKPVVEIRPFDINGFAHYFIESGKPGAHFAFQPLSSDSGLFYSLPQGVLVAG
jgi:hypothetical protein